MYIEGVQRNMVLQIEQKITGLNIIENGEGLGFFFFLQIR